MKEGWEYKKLGEVCEILDKQRKPVTKSARTNGVYPYYGATGIQDYVADYIFDGRFVLVGEDGAKWGACENTAFIIEGKSWVNNHAHIIKFDSNIIDSFAVYFLNFSNLDSFISGAVVKKLTQASMKNIVLPLPPLSQQQSIVAELDKINEIIDLKKAQLKDLDLLAQSIFYDMFGDPIENPKGWEVKKLEEVSSIIAGGDKPKDIFESPKGDYIYPVIANGEGTKGVLGYSNKYRISIPSVTIGARGASIGNCRIIKEKFTPVVRLITISPKECLGITYLYFYAKDVRYKSNGAGQAQLTVPNIKGENIPLPPLSLQQSFASKIQAIESQKSAIKQSLADAETLLASRMDYWFG